MLSYLISTFYSLSSPFFFFFHYPPPPDIYTLSLHDALPIYLRLVLGRVAAQAGLARDAVRVDLGRRRAAALDSQPQVADRSEEHTSELQSHHDLVCRLLLEKKKKNTKSKHHQENDTYTTQHS